MPYAFYYALGAAIVMWYVFDYTPLGRRLLFVGRGREVARLNGISVDRVRLGALVTSGVLSALAGILYAGVLGSADPYSGLNFLLPAFAAAFLGATTILPGRFNPWGVIVAVYFLATGITGLTMLGIPLWVTNVFNGGALILAVTISQLTRSREAIDMGSVLRDCGVLRRDFLLEGISNAVGSQKQTSYSRIESVLNHQE